MPNWLDNYSGTELAERVHVDQEGFATHSYFKLNTFTFTFYVTVQNIGILQVEKRINDALSHFNGSLTGWDVNNEMTHGEVLLTNTNDTDIRCQQPSSRNIHRYPGSRCTSGLIRRTPACSCS